MIAILLNQGKNEMIAILLKFQLLRYLLILFEYSSEIRIFAKT